MIQRALMKAKILTKALVFIFKTMIKRKLLNAIAKNLLIKAKFVLVERDKSLIMKISVKNLLI